MPKLLREWVQKAGQRAGSSSRRLLDRSKKSGSSIRNRLPKNFDDVDLKKFDLKRLGEHQGAIRWGLLICAVFLTAELVSRGIGLFLRPVYPGMPKKMVSAPSTTVPSEDYDAILRRNMFNVEGKIPAPFDQGLLDCLSQAKPSTQKMQLLGTIVMGDDKRSVALLQEDGSADKIAVKKDESFFSGKFVAMKVERKKFCFQVKSSQEFEFIEIPEENMNLGVVPGATMNVSTTDGIVASSDTQFAVKKNFLNEKLMNLNEILQTARAVPNTDPATGKFKGFLIQSMESNSPFASLGVRQNDVITDVNDITLDNPGKGLEAFQKLKDAPKVQLGILRNGQKMTLNYEVR